MRGTRSLPRREEKETGAACSAAEIGECGRAQVELAKGRVEWRCVRRGRDSRRASYPGEAERRGKGNTLEEA